MGEVESLRSEVLALAASRDGGLWVSVWPSGLFYCKGGKCETVEGPPEHRQLHGYALLVDQEGDLWVSIGDGIVLRRHAGEWTEFNRTNGLPFSYIFCLAQGPSGEVWAGSQEEGLYVFRAGRFQVVPGMDAAIRSVQAGSDGVIWVGTRAGGLCRLMPRRLMEYPVGQENRRGQTGGLVEEPPGQFWVTTYGGGLFRGSLDRLEPVLGVEALEGRFHLLAGLKMSDGAVYIAGATLLLRREPGTGEFSALPAFIGTLRALCEGVDGSLWAGTREGELKRRVDGALQTVTNGVFPTQINAVVRGPGAALWVATQGAGLYRWDAGRVQRWTTAEGLSTDVLRALHQDSEGTLWIGTAGGGLAWLQAGRFHSVNTRQGLGDGVISQILEDDQGNLWLGCNRGIFRVSKRELQDVVAGRAAAVYPLALDESDGMSVAECTGGFSPAGLRSQSGTLYFSTVRGVVAVDPAQFGPTPNPPTVLIEEVKLDGKPIPVSGGSLTLQPGPRELEIHYTAFNYAKPEPIRFRHRLGGENQEWVDAGRTRSARYSRLRPGDYVFEVTAANLDGRWQETGAKLTFAVLPFAWQTWWFRVAALAALFGCGGFTTWWLVRRRHQRELQNLERTRQHQAELAHVTRVSNMGQLASSLAHELNQPLGAILRNAEAAELFLQDPSPDLGELRAILADIRKDDQRAGEVIDRMRGLMKRREVEHRRLDLNVLVGDVVALVRPDAAMCRVRLVLETNPALPLVHGDRVQLQQVVLNLLLNALDALSDNPPESPLVTVRTRPSGATAEVAVSDNGHGIAADKLLRVFESFYTSKPNGLGMGLAISRSIIEAHGGRLRAENNADRGATFHFTLPVTKERGERE